MSTDPGGVERHRPHGEPPLPRLVSLATRVVELEAPRRRNFESRLEPHRTIEVVVETDGPVPIRALSPVLHVGSAVLTEVSADDETHYRFRAAVPVEFVDDAPVVMAWSGQPPNDVERRDDVLRLELPPDW